MTSLSTPFYLILSRLPLIPFYPIISSLVPSIKSTTPHHHLQLTTPKQSPSKIPTLKQAQVIPSQNSRKRSNTPIPHQQHHNLWTLHKMHISWIQFMFDYDSTKRQGWKVEYELGLLFFVNRPCRCATYKSHAVDSFTGLSQVPCFCPCRSMVFDPWFTYSQLPLL